jgi:PKD repeat protein
MQWYVDIGALPAGLTLNPLTGAITGTPTAEGVFTFTVNVSNHFGSDTREFTLIITDTAHTNAPVVTTISLPVGAVGSAYTGQLAASGDMPIFWSVTTGSLPAGLSLNANTGAITGTPTTAGDVTFTVTATNGAGSDTKEFTVRISATAHTTAPTITTDSLPVGIVGTAYSSAIDATGDTPMQWYVDIGALPVGLTLDPLTGAVTGTPTVEGMFTFTVNVSNHAGSDTKVYTVIVTNTAHTNMPVITTISLPVGAVGSAYTGQLAATGDTPIFWSVTTGSLPAGLTLDTNTGAITGTPITDGVTYFTVTATNGFGSDSKELFILVSATAHTVGPTITTDSLPAGTVGTSYSAFIVATGETPMQWFIDSGALPDGLTLDPLTGEISGTPIAYGIFTFAVNVSNNYGDDVKVLTITINDPSGTMPPRITTKYLEPGQVGSYYDQPLEATGDGVIIWSLDSGALPAGLALDPIFGDIYGIPASGTEGVHIFTVRAENAHGFDTKELAILITDGTHSVPPTIKTPRDLPPGIELVSYSEYVEADGDVPMVWYVVNGSLPTGLSLDFESGEIEGTPASGTEGVYVFTVLVLNGAGSDEKEFVLLITDGTHSVPPVITTTSLPAGNVGRSYNSQLEADGDTPMAWVIVEGLNSLPPGLSLDPITGVISGTPTATGTFPFDVKVINGAGYDVRTFSITINAAATGGGGSGTGNATIVDPSQPEPPQPPGPEPPQPPGPGPQPPGGPDEGYEREEPSVTAIYASMILLFFLGIIIFAYRRYDERKFE